MKKTLALVAALAVLASAASFAEASSIKDKTRNLVTPQKKIRNISKSLAPAQTGQGTGTQGGEEQTAPAPAVAIEIGDIVFSPESPSRPSCEKKWIVSFTNTGAVDSGTDLVMAPVYRLSPGVNERVGSETPLTAPIPSKETRSYTGYLSLRERMETELLLNLRKGDTVVASKVFALPESVMPSADTVELGDATFSPSEISFTVRNKGAVDVNAMVYTVRGVPNAGGTASEQIAMAPVPFCLPGGESQTFSATIPAAPYPSYIVRLTLSGSGQVFTERTYVR